MILKTGKFSVPAEMRRSMKQPDGINAVYNDVMIMEGQ